MHAQRRAVSVATTLKRGRSFGLQRQGSAKFESGNLNSLRQGSSKSLTRLGSGQLDSQSPRSPQRLESDRNAAAWDLEEEETAITEAELRNQLFQRDRDLRATNNRVERLQMILDKRHTDNVMTVDEIKNKNLRKERELDSFLHLVERRIELGFRYTAVVSLTLFLLVYVVAIFLQMDSQARFSIESPVLNTLVGELDRETQSLRSANDFYTWMNSQLVDQIFVDPVCGDGVCEAPEEFAGFGRFGCAVDCGRFLQTTTVSVKMSDFAAMSGQVGWDLSKVRRGIHPEFRYNIYSHSMGDFLFEEDLVPNGTTLVLDLPDGEYDVRLYQMRAVATEVDDATTFSTLSVLPASLPVPELQTDFSYGDAREAFSAAALFLRQVREHCWGGSLLNFDFNCLEYPEVDTLVKVLGSYGLQGTVTTATGARERTTLADVAFCGMVPDGLGGLRNASNKEALKAAAAPCGGRRGGRGASGAGGGEEAGGGESAELDGWLRARERWEQSEGERAGAERKLREGVRRRGAGEVEGAGGAGGAKGGVGDGEGGVEGGVARRMLQLSGREGPCVWHDMCDQSGVDAITGEAGMFCAAGGYCDTCSFCQRDAVDSIDGACPLVKCTAAGGLPQCLDAGLLAASWTCPSSVPFSIRSFTLPGEPVEIRPPAEAKTRFVTPFNRLVGAVVLSQERQRRGVCKGIVNQDVQELVRTEGCMEGVDGAPFGLDAVFVATSSLYNGKLDAGQVYLPSERTNSSRLVPLQGGGSARVTEASVPFGFFPHQHDSRSGGDRAASAVLAAHKDEFLVFLDSRLSRQQARTIGQYLVQGGFLTAETSTVKAVIPMLNAEHNYFSLAEFSFQWLVGGRMSWDYSVRSFSVDLYEGAEGIVRMSFEIVAALMLSINVMLELWDILYHARTMTLKDYIFAGGNAVDWAHMGLSIYAWILWVQHVQLTSSFQMRSEYAVLADPTSSVRPLLTNPAEEVAMLELAADLRKIADSLSHYSAVACVVIIFFIIRVIKALDFQPRLSIVTQCIAKAITDLFHFVMLFGVIHLGFAATGTLLFGHQFRGMSSLALACQTLTMMLLTMDRTQFYEQMEHAAPEWAFHIYLWVYIVIAYFLAYLGAKDGLPDSNPITEEVWDLLVHAWKSMTAPKTRFMSDWALRDVLERKKRGLPSSLALRAAVLETVDLDFAVHLPGGLLVTPKQLAKLIEEPPDPTDEQEQPTPRLAGRDGQRAGADDDDDDDDDDDSASDDGWEGGIDSRTRDLLDRYGGYKGGAALDDHEEAALMGVLEQEDIEIQILHHQRQVALLHGMERARVLLERVVPKMLPTLGADGTLIGRTDSLSEQPPLPAWMMERVESGGSVTFEGDTSTRRAEDGGGAAESEEEGADQVEGAGPADDSAGGRKIGPRVESGVTWLEVTVLEGEELPIADKLGATDAVYCAVAMADAVGEELFREEAKRTRQVQKGARWTWNESMVVKARRLRPGEEEKLLTVMVLGEEGSIGEGVLGTVQVNVRALVEGTLTRRPSHRAATSIHRFPSPEPMIDPGAGAAGGEHAAEDGEGVLPSARIATELEGWYKLTNTHRPREEMEHARLHLKVRPWHPPEGETVDSAPGSARPTTAASAGEGAAAEAEHGRRCRVM